MSAEGLKKEIPSSSSSNRFLLPPAIFAILLCVPIAHGQDSGAAGTVLGDELNLRLAGLADSPISLPARVVTGRSADIENAALDLGMKNLPGEEMAGANAVLSEMFLATAQIEAKRNEVIAKVRQRKLFASLGRSFLNAVFEQKAVDPATGDFRADFDQGFVRERAEKSDVSSITEWRVIRDLLQSGEMVLLDGQKLETGGKTRPARFDELYPTYRDAAEKILVNLRDFDQTLPGRVEALQKQFSADYFAAYADRVGSLKQPSLAALSSVKMSLESEEFRDLVVAHMGDRAVSASASEITDSSPVVPTAAPLPRALVASSSGSTRPDGIIPATVGPPDGPVSFPLPDPQLPPLPNVKCRIVVVKMPGAKPTMSQEAFAAVQRDDYADVVKLADRMSPENVVAIRVDGQPVRWNQEGKRDSARAQAVLAFETEWLGGWFWVERDGRIKCDRAVRPDELVKELEALKGVVHCSVDYHLVFAITADGARHVLGRDRDHPNLRLALAGIENIVKADFGSASFASALKNDGSVATFVQEKKFGLSSAPGACIHQYVYAVKMGSDRKVVLTGGAYANALPLLDEVGSSVREFVPGPNENPVHAIQLENLEWRFLYGPARGGTLTWHVDLGKALGDAVQIARPREDGFIVALLPADSVPRSGIWELGELVAHRAKKGE